MATVTSTTSKTPILFPQHHQHLLSEGFTVAEIETLVNQYGVRSMASEEAARRKLYVFNPTATPPKQTCDGLWFPFGKGVNPWGQLRLDLPLADRDGKIRKYTQPAGQAVASWIPDGFEAISEGFKDSAKPTLMGAPTAAIVGVDNILGDPTLRQCKKPIIFDSDGWYKPQVVRALISGALWTEGKINLFPQMGEYPTGGGCEFFKVGGSLFQYKKLINDAFKPHEFLSKWCEQWHQLDEVTRREAYSTMNKCLYALREAPHYLKYLYRCRLEKQQNKGIGPVGEVQDLDDFPTSHPFQITQMQLEGLLEKAEKHSGYPQKKREKIQKEDAAVIAQRLQSLLATEADESQENDKYLKPDELTIEQHLFNLTFADPRQPIQVMEHVFRQYNPEMGYWAPLPDELINQRILDNADKAYRWRKRANGEGYYKASYGTSANQEKTTRYAATKLFYGSTNQDNKHLVAFTNGTVDLRTGDLLEHSPDNHITSCLPYEYRSGADCPESMRAYVESSFGADNLEYVRACLGLILDLTAPNKFVHCIGPSGSGKGVFTRLCMKFFGSESVGSPNNFRIFSNPDQVHQYLSGKRLLAIDDIVGFIGEEIGSFYTAVERTAMNARCLFKPKGYTQPFDIRYTVASVGHLPTKYSNSKGWERRVVPLPTTGRQAADRNLEQRLENDIADIISWVLDQDKAERNRILEHPERYNPAAEEYFTEAAFNSSSAWAFVEECLTPATPHSTDSYNSQGVDEGDMYRCYQAYCFATGKKPMGMDGFKHELRQALPANWVDRRKGGTLPRRFVYINIRPGIFDKSEHGAVSCNISALRCDGVAMFKEWTRQYASLHPYASEQLQVMAAPKQEVLATCAARAGHAPPDQPLKSDEVGQNDVSLPPGLNEENRHAQPARAAHPDLPSTQPLPDCPYDHYKDLAQAVAKCKTWDEVLKAAANCTQPFKHLAWDWLWRNDRTAYERIKILSPRSPSATASTNGGTAP